MIEPCIPLSMPVYNRPDCLAQTLRSLSRSSLPAGSILVVHDDASDDPRVAELLSSVSALPLVHRCNADNQGHNRNSVGGLAACFRDYPAAEYVLNIDSDTVFNPHWLEALTACLHRHRDRRVAAVSAFNIEHRWHRTVRRLDDGTCVKSSLGGFGLLIPRVFWDACGEELCRLVESQPAAGWDWLLSDLARRDGWELLALSDSYVQHIGLADGVHTGKGAQADVALNFLGMDLADHREAAPHHDTRLRCEELRRLALAQYREGQTEEALATLREATTVGPEIAQQRLILAALLHELGRCGEAVPEYRAALEADEALDEARRGLCEALRELGAFDLEAARAEEAARCYRELLAHAPHDLEARNNLGVALQRGGRWDAARAEFEAVLEADPTHVDAHVNLGVEDQRRGHHRLAVAHYQAALEKDPDHFAACSNLATLRKITGHLDQATEYARHAVRRGTGDATEALTGLELRRLLHLPAVYQSVDEIEAARERLRAGLNEFDKREVRFTDPLAAVGVTNFFLAYHGYGDADIQSQLARLYRRAYRPPPLPIDRPDDPRIRVGLVSSYFNNHTIGKLNLGTVRQLDRSRFSVHVFSIGEHRDRTARAFEEAADSYTALPRRLEAMRGAIAAAGLDLLLFTDIGMDAVTYFLAFSRLAPVQCATWGHPVTTGIDTMDYFISACDAETGDSDRHYTEQLVRLPTMQPFYYRPTIAGPRKQRIALGLPDDKTLYICPQTLFKFHPDFDPMLGAILRGDPRGVLVLIEAQDNSWTELLKARFRTTLPDVADRILFLPRMSGADFLSLVAAGDVMLDTPVFCGGNTTYEGLAMGTPIVTLPSELARGRLSYAIYRKMGMMDCVADGPQSYVNIALQLGRDQELRRAVSEAILSLCPVLYEDARPVRELEAFIEQAVGEAGKAGGSRAGASP